MASIRQAWLKRGGDGQYAVQWSMRPWLAHVTQGRGCVLFPLPCAAGEGRGGVLFAEKRPDLPSLVGLRS